VPQKRRTEPQAVPPVQLVISPEEAATKIEARTVKGTELSSLTINSVDSFEQAEREYKLWNDYNREMLSRIFSSNEIADEYSRAGRTSIMLMGPPSLGEKIQRFHAQLDAKSQCLKSILSRLELIPTSSLVEDSNPSAPLFRQAKNTKKVFVVHGHDEVAKTNLEIFLAEIGLEPIVLHRQADEGLTVIEKFEKHSDVGYAFILLTPDDVAYLRRDEEKPDAERTKEFRARQNVIFEFGYFVGKLGRSRVCCLYTGSVTLPSDVSGMIYKRYEKNIEEVAYSVIKDLKAVGMQIK
jgi:predicted nucleotide-binding protein